MVDQTMTYLAGTTTVLPCLSHAVLRN